MASQNPVKLSFLFSYAYIRTGGTLMMDAIQELAKVSRVMIDCGAYTVFKTGIKQAKARKPYQPITLVEYMDACKHFGNCYQYIQLDVIGDPAGTRRNYDIMRQSGLTPMPVFTGGAPYSDLQYYSTQWRDICYGGIVTHSTDEAYTKIVLNGMKVAGKKTRFHLLGFARYPLVMSLPIKSFDSSSYAAGQQYGRLAVFSPQTGIISYGKNENPLEFVSALHRHNISTKLMQTGAWTGQRGMPTMTTMYAHLSMMAHVLQTKKQYYFLAVPNMHLLEALLAVHAATNAQGYDYPLALDHYNELRAAHKNPVVLLDLIKEKASL